MPWHGQGCLAGRNSYNEDSECNFRGCTSKIENVPSKSLSVAGW